MTQQSFTRQDLRRFLKGCPWPCAPAMVVNIARDNGAPDSLLAQFGSVANRVYLSERDFLDELERVSGLSRA